MSLFLWFPLVELNLVADSVFYVSPAGKDQWSGRLAEPAADGRDGPLASLMTALRAARSARETGGRRPESIRILMRAGHYELSEPIHLTAADSGYSAAQPLLIANYPGEHPIVSGGRRISGWTRTPGAEVAWQAELPEVRAGKSYIRSLFVNGQRAIRARKPNVGSYFRMEGARTGDNPVRFHFRAGEVNPHWAAEPDAELIAFEKWTDFRQHIRSVSTADNLVELSGQAAEHTRESGAQYFVENTSDAFDAPGEWQLDRASGILRYRPLPGEELATAEAIAPRLGSLIELAGDDAARSPVRHVILRGLTFSHTDWAMADRGYTDTQAAVHIRGDCRATFAVDCAIEQCTFSHLGGYAIDLGQGCQGWRVAGNEIVDIGAGGVRLGEPGASPDAFSANHGHRITDNHLHALGRVYAPAVGVLILQSGTNQVAHNSIHDLFYTAISAGWNWGYQETPCRENILEYNHIYDLGQGLLSDMGAVYTLGIQHGTVVRNNRIHDVDAFTYGGWGLYPDEGSTGILWENNVVYRTKSAGFHQHYGRENIVRNNVFAFAREHQLMRTREEAHLSFLFTNNIVYFDSGTLLGSNWKNDRFVMENNIYFDARPAAAPIRFPGDTLEQWRARGHDLHSLIVDPGFVAPERFNFALRSNSPALKLGIRPINLDSIGPRTQPGEAAPVP